MAARARFLLRDQVVGGLVAFARILVARLTIDVAM